MILHNNSIFEKKVSPIPGICCHCRLSIVGLNGDAARTQCACQLISHDLYLAKRNRVSRSEWGKHDNKSLLMLKLQLSVTSSRRNLFSFEKKGKPFIQEYYQNINFQHNNTTVFQVDMFLDIKFLLKISKFIKCTFKLKIYNRIATLYLSRSEISICTSATFLL